MGGGISGFDNYLSIKHRHFKSIESFLKSQSVSNDLANKLYEFFSSYLNASGTPFFVKTPLHKNIYAPVYNNSEDVSLFYKTKELFYVKTDTIYKDTCTQFKGFSINISASNLGQKKDNNKSNKEISLELISISESVINFNAHFKADSDSNFKAISKALKGVLNISEDEYKALKQEFKKQNTIDFFIHKNAAKFLKEQFDLFLYHYFYKDLGIDTQWSSERLEELKTLKLIAYKIIELIAKLENEILRIWLKPKFVKNLNYVFSLDLLRGLESDITSDDGFAAQLKEWQELGMNYESFDSTLPLDTKYFSPKIRETILSHFDNLNEILNGELIKSDNFNALNTLKNKYRGKVKCIYIDPPYNTANDDFVYFDKFNHATWLSFMRDRLALAREFLSDDGAIFVQCDDNEQARLKLLMDEVFGEENFINCIVVKTKDTAGVSGGGEDKKLKKNTEYIFLYSKNKYFYNVNNVYIEDDLFSTVDNLNSYEYSYVLTHKGDKKLIDKVVSGSGLELDIYSLDEIEFISIKQVAKKDKISLEEAYVKYFEYIYSSKDAQTSIRDIAKQYDNDFIEICYIPTKGKHKNKKHNIIFGGKTKRLYNPLSEIAYKNQNSIVKKTILGDLWTNINLSKLNVEGGVSFDNAKKPENLIKQVFELTTNENDLVMDFHLGSGTTAAVAHKMNRRYIGVELGEYFYTTTMPRLKKVINAEQGGISKALVHKGGGAFVYYELESYEEALRECEYATTSEICLIDYKKSRKLIKSLEIGEKIYIDKNCDYFKDIDIFASFTNIYGLEIISYELKNNELFINTSDGKSLCLKDLDLGTYARLRDYLWWKSDE